MTEVNAFADTPWRAGVIQDFARSELFDRTFEEGMQLVEETAAYLDGAGRHDSKILSRNALAYAGDANLRFKGGEYELRVAGGGSYVAGEKEAIERFQRASSHYAQRPDRTYSRLDPTRTSLAGWSLQASIDRTAGEHWLWGASMKADSENFETNDFANLNGADGLTLSSNIRYRETRPGRVFRNYSIAFNQSRPGS